MQLAGLSKCDPRGGSRSNVLLQARLDTNTTSFVVRVRNLSINGALLEGEGLPIEGTFVRLRRGRLNVRGEVAWQQAERRGLRFSTDIDVTSWVKPVLATGQQRIDSILTALRENPNDDCRWAKGEPSQHVTLEVLSSDLDEICES